MLRVLAIVTAMMFAAPAMAATVDAPVIRTTTVELASFGEPATETITFENEAFVDVMLTSFAEVDLSFGTFSFNSPGPVAAATFAGIHIPAGEYTFSLTGPLAAASINVAEVPLPAGVVLFGTALAGLGIYRRLRASNA